MTNLTKRWKSWPLAMLVAVVMLAGNSDHAISQQTSLDDAERVETLKQFAARHRFVADTYGDDFKLYPKPVLTWTNPTRGDVFGGLFLWLDEKRPIACGGIFVWLDGNSRVLGRELHSLDSRSIKASYDGRELWKFRGPGVTFQTLSGNWPTSVSESFQLRRIKQFASRFRITISSPGEGSEITRLLPTPLYHYRDDASGVMDGFVFGFVQGNDPEALLLVEVSSGTGSQSQLRFAIARCTTWAVDAELDGNLVYQRPRYDYRRLDREAVFVSVPRSRLE
jgi:hypothetical protein